MAALSMDDVASMVPERFEMLKKNGKISIFPKTQLFEKILDNPAPGGGNAIVIPIEVTAPEASVSESTTFTATQKVGYVEAKMTFNYQYIYRDFVINEADVDLIRSAKEAVSYLDHRIKNGSNKLRQTIESGGLIGTAATTTTMAGFNSFWQGAAYGGLAREDTVAFADDDAVSLNTILGSNVAYVYVTDGTDTPEAYETYWDVRVAYAASVDQGQLVVDAMRAMVVHTSTSGDESTDIVVAKDILTHLLKYADDKGRAVEYGMTKSVTATGGLVLTFMGKPVTYSEKMTAGLAFVLNSDYIMVPSVSGATMDKVKQKVIDSTKYGFAKEVQLLATGRIVTNAVVKHGKLIFK